MPGDHALDHFALGETERNEVTDYQDARSIGASEGCWRTFNFSMYGRSPPVTRLPVHLQNLQRCQYETGTEREAVDRGAPATELTAWLEYIAYEPHAASRALKALTVSDTLDESLAFKRTLRGLLEHHAKATAAYRESGATDDATPLRTAQENHELSVDFGTERLRNRSSGIRCNLRRRHAYCADSIFDPAQCPTETATIGTAFCMALAAFCTTNMVVVFGGPAGPLGFQPPFYPSPSHQTFTKFSFSTSFRTLPPFYHLLPQNLFLGDL